MAHEALFWRHAEPLFAQSGVTRSTMMGLPCLRINGEFFGSFDRKTGDLLVKLPAGRVEEMIQSGSGHEFAPAGRRFREWAAISPADQDSWPALLDDALAFVSKTVVTGG